MKPMTSSATANGIFATNSREQQEISTLCLQLVQNCLMLINTLLVR